MREGVCEAVYVLAGEGKREDGGTWGVSVMKPNTWTNVMSADKPQLYLHRASRATMYMGAGRMGRVTSFCAVCAPG
jgi:hypothetical protein